MSREYFDLSEYLSPESLDACVGWYDGMGCPMYGLQCTGLVHVDRWDDLVARVESLADEHPDDLGLESLRWDLQTYASAHADTIAQLAA